MWLGFACVEVVLSPNVQEYVSGWPSGSDEPALEKLAVSGAGPDVGLADAAAVGAWFPPVQRIRRILLIPEVPLRRAVRDDVSAPEVAEPDRALAA